MYAPRTFQGLERTGMQKKDRDFVGAIEKGLAVIEAFDASSQRMTLSDVARKNGLTRGNRS